MRDYNKLTNAQKRLIDEINAKLGLHLAQHGFEVGYHQQLGGGTSIVLFSKIRSHTEVLQGIMNSVEGVELFINTYNRAHTRATREVTAANEAALRKLMGVKVNRDGTLFVHVPDDMEIDEQD